MADCGKLDDASDLSAFLANARHRENFKHEIRLLIQVDGIAIKTMHMK
jgi:hypothetical protein